MRIGSLFSGIGGLELGLERAGVGSVAWQCEIDPYARAVLAKHWPDAIRFEDVTKMLDVPPVDVICGGFPCQDISNAGRRNGIHASRSGLFFELMRCVRMVRPNYVVLENVAALLTRGMGEVLGELAESGFDSEWDCIPASAVGAPHQRDRIFIIADDAQRERRKGDNQPQSGETEIPEPDRRVGGASGVADAGHGRWTIGGKWEAEPDVGRVANGIPSQVDRLRCLGNAVVPQVAEVVGRRMTDIAAIRLKE